MLVATLHSRAVTRHVSPIATGVLTMVLVCVVTNVAVTGAIGVVNGRITVFASVEAIASYFDFFAKDVLLGPENPELHQYREKPSFTQQSSNTCGVAALRYILNYYGVSISEEILSQYVGLSETGASMAELASAAEQLGFQATGMKVSLERLKSETCPVIAFVLESHYVVVRGIDNDRVFLFDPAPGVGRVTVSSSHFLRLWDGAVLLVTTAPILGL